MSIKSLEYQMLSVYLKRNPNTSAAEAAGIVADIRNAINSFQGVN